MSWVSEQAGSREGGGMKFKNVIQTMGLIRQGTQGSLQPTASKELGPWEQKLATSHVTWLGSRSFEAETSNGTTACERP